MQNGWSSKLWPKMVVKFVICRFLHRNILLYVKHVEKNVYFVVFTHVHKSFLNCPEINFKGLESQFLFSLKNIFSNALNT